MKNCIVVGSCATNDFVRVEQALRALPTVDSVGSLREKGNKKRNCTTVYITFCDEASAQAAHQTLSSIEGLLLSGSCADHDRKPPRVARTKRDTDVTAALLTSLSCPSPPSTAVPTGQGQQAGSATRQRARKPLRGTRHVQSVAQQQAPSSPERHASKRTDANATAMQDGAPLRPGSSRKDLHAPRPRAPPFEASAVFVDHVPFGTPNDVLMERFAPFGRVLDVNRLDTMVMVCYDNPASAQECVQQLNGTRLGGQVITVSSGIVRIPAHVAAYIGV